jgi:hypothetical protein
MRNRIATFKLVVTLLAGMTLLTGCVEYAVANAVVQVVTTVVPPAYKAAKGYLEDKGYFDEKIESESPLPAVSDEAICRLALPVKTQTNKIEWETSGYFGDVAEAKGRGFTPESCARLIGRDIQVASGSAPSETSLASLSNSQVCNLGTRAIRRGVSTWDPSLPGHSKEAEKRGLSLDACDKLLGRDNQPATSQQARKEEAVSDSMLCHQALLPVLSGATAWETNSDFFEIVADVQQRGFTPTSCAKLLGRSVQVASSTTPSEFLSDLPTGALCSIATRNDGRWAGWDDLLPSHVAEAKRRKLSLRECAELTGKKYQNVFQVVREEAEEKRKKQVAKNALLADVERDSKEKTVRVDKSVQSQTSTETFKTEDMNDNFVVLKYANLRVGPSTDTKVTGNLKAETTVRVTGKVVGKNWYRLTGGYFVFGALIKPYKPKLPQKKVVSTVDAEASQTSMNAVTAKKPKLGLYEENDVEPQCSGVHSALTSQKFTTAAALTKKRGKGICAYYLARYSSKNLDAAVRANTVEWLDLAYENVDRIDFRELTAKVLFMKLEIGRDANNFSRDRRELRRLDKSAYESLRKRKKNELMRPIILASINPLDAGPTCAIPEIKLPWLQFLIANEASYDKQCEAAHYVRQITTYLSEKRLVTSDQLAKAKKSLMTVELRSTELKRKYPSVIGVSKAYERHVDLSTKSRKQLDEASSF